MHTQVWQSDTCDLSCFVLSLINIKILENSSFVFLIAQLQWTNRKVTSCYANVINISCKADTSLDGPSKCKFEIKSKVPFRAWH